jgi:ABC-type sugar transport system ATPase subunit
MKEILKLENITKTFPGVIALSNVNLEIYEGEVLGLVGENGAGKSTLMKILAGIYRPDEGKILYEGKEVAIHTPLQAQQLGLSIIFQEFNLVNSLSVAENIFSGRLYTRKFLGVDWKRVYLETKNLLQSVGLDISPKKKVETLSVAQKQMVEIAKALSFDSKIIIMDEPSATLTDNEINHLFKIIEKLKEKGKTIVYISHRLQEVFDLTDRIAVLRDGSLVRIASTDSYTKESIVEAMVGREMSQEFPPRDSKPQQIERLRVDSLTSEGKFYDISFTLTKGEVLGIAGLVGAGRTEIARAIFGVDPNMQGKIFINGEEYHKPNPKDSIRNQIAFLTENRKEEGLILQESVKRHITMANLKSITKLGLIDAKSEVAIAEQYRDSLKIKTPNVDQTVVSLSGGNQQKTILAKWLYSDADIFILDEPTRGIDVGAKYEIYLLINNLVKLGKSVIMISSELPEIVALSDRVLVMHNGRITGELAKEEINAEKIMALAIA